MLTWAQNAGLAALGTLLLSCGPAECPPVPVRLPSELGQIPWTQGGSMRASVELNGTMLQGLLDTGYPRSAITLEAAAGVALGGATVTAGGTVSGPLA